MVLVQASWRWRWHQVHCLSNHPVIEPRTAWSNKWTTSVALSTIVQPNFMRSAMVQIFSKALIRVWSELLIYTNCRSRLKSNSLFWTKNVNTIYITFCLFVSAAVAHSSNEALLPPLVLCPANVANVVRFVPFRMGFSIAPTLERSASTASLLKFRLTDPTSTSLEKA